MALFIGLWLFLSIPTICYYIYAPVSTFIQLFLGLLFTLPCAIAVLSIPYKIGRVILLTLIGSIVLIELVTTVIHGSYFNASEIVAFVAANPYESNDMGTFILQHIPWHLTSYFALLFILIVGLILVPVECKKYVITSCVIIPIIIMTHMFTPLNIFDYAPYHLLEEMHTVMHENSVRKKMLSNDHKKISSTRVGDRTESEIYVLALGESLRYANLSMNNKYSRITTPKLSKISNLQLYSNYYSQAVFTTQSVPMILTRITPKNYLEHFIEPTISYFFQQNNFTTTLISHRAQLMNNGIHDYLTYGNDTIIMVEHDSLIVNALQKCITRKGKQFILLHFLGNHFFYENHPDEYYRYLPDYNLSPRMKNDSLFFNAYDNSVLYADYLLASCIHQLEQLHIKSTLVFVSDHGEYLAEQLCGHGFRNTPTEDEYHPPLMVWYSSEYESEKPNKIANLVKHKDDAISGDYIFWSLLDMSDIYLECEQKKGLSIFGDSLVQQDRTLLLPDGKTVIVL